MTRTHDHAAEAVERFVRVAASRIELQLRRALHVELDGAARTADAKRRAIAIAVGDPTEPEIAHASGCKLRRKRAQVIRIHRARFSSRGGATVPGDVSARHEALLDVRRQRRAGDRA